MISDEEKEHVRQATDVLSLVSESCELRRRGSSYWGCCPFHGEKSPSFHVNPDTGLWKCFGCGKGGDIFAFVMEREQLGFMDAIRYLADKAHIELKEEAHVRKGPKKARLYEALDASAEFFLTMLMRGRTDACQEARMYFKNRGFNADVCKRWQLGFAPGFGMMTQELRKRGFTDAELDQANLCVRGKDRFFNRVMFPIHDESGHCIGFGGRVLDDSKPKYLNTSETPVFHKSKHMYALDRARETIVAKAQAIVVEGYTDVIAMHEAGFTNVVATLGTALSEDHVKKLSRFAKTIIFMFDGDRAGKMAAERALKYLNSTTSDLRCVVLPDDLDPADFLSQRGASALAEQLEQSRPLIDFVFESRVADYDLSIPGQKIEAFNTMCSLLAVFKNTVLLDSYAMRLSDLLQIDFERARTGIQNSEPPVDQQGAPRDRKQKSPSRQSYTDAYDDVVSVDVYDVLPADIYDAPPIDSYASGTGTPLYAQEPPQEEAVLMSRDDLQQARFEAELMSLFVEYPDMVKPYKDTILSIDWVESDHQRLAEAFLATPDMATSADLMSLAYQITPKAASILTAGKLGVLEGDTERKIIFLLLNIELHQIKRAVRAYKASLATCVDPVESANLLNNCTVLNQRLREISENLSKL